MVMCMSFLGQMVEIEKKQKMFQTIVSYILPAMSMLKHFAVEVADLLNQDLILDLLERAHFHLGDSGIDLML